MTFPKYGWATRRRSHIQDGQYGGSKPDVYRQELTFISGCGHDSKKHSNGVTHVSGSGNPERLTRILSDVWVCRKSKMVVTDLK